MINDMPKQNQHTVTHKLYELNDMVRTDCGGCEGCSSCCRGMGTSIVLDPFDVFQLALNLNKKFEELLQLELELNMQNGIILPNLPMAGAEESCIFLDEDGRCRVHAFRPGICRTFPLGRQYENGKLFYFPVQGECQKEKRSKVKVNKWLSLPDVNRNQQFVADWHEFKKAIENILKKETDMEKRKTSTMFLLQQFYAKSYAPEDDFYAEFYQRLRDAKEIFSIE